MPDTEITRAETRERARLLIVRWHDADWDFTHGPDTFGSVSLIRFDCHEPGSTTHADLIAAGVIATGVRMSTLNGVPLDPTSAWAPGRLGARNQLRVIADRTFTPSASGCAAGIPPTAASMVARLSQGHGFAYHSQWPADPARARLPRGPGQSPGRRRAAAPDGARSRLCRILRGACASRIGPECRRVVDDVVLHEDPRLPRRPATVRASGGVRRLDGQRGDCEHCRITYAKGAAVLRQLSANVGEERFTEGCAPTSRALLPQCPAGDLVASMGEASGKDLAPCRYRPSPRCCAGDALRETPGAERPVAAGRLAAQPVRFPSAGDGSQVAAGSRTGASRPSTTKE